MFTARYELTFYVYFILTVVSEELNMHPVGTSDTVFIECTVRSSPLRPRKRKK